MQESANTYRIPMKLYPNIDPDIRKLASGVVVPGQQVNVIPGQHVNGAVCAAPASATSNFDRPSFVPQRVATD